MKRKDVLKYTVCLAVFLFLRYTENRFGVRAFAAAFFFGLVYNRQNLILLAPLYLIASVAVEPAFKTLAIAGAPIVVAALALLFHYKLRARLSLLAVGLYTLLSSLPLLFFETSDTEQIVRTVIGIVASEGFLYVFISLQYLVLRKRLRFRLTSAECIAAGIFTAVCGLGLSYLDIFSFSVYYFILVVAVLALRSAGIAPTLVAAVCFGAGAGLGYGSPEPVAVSVLFGVLACCFKPDYAYFGGIIGVVLCAVGLLIGFLPHGFLFLIAPTAATALLVCFPKKLRGELTLFAERFREGKTTRAVVNRDRAEVARRLGGLAGVFNEISDILDTEAAEERAYDSLALAKEVAERCCEGCLAESSCRAALGGNSTEIVLNELAASALACGKATILDTPPFLSSRCRKISGIIGATNEALHRIEREEERENGLNEGKTMLREQLEGLAALLSELGEEVSRPLSYDASRERLLAEELNKRGINGTEIYAFGEQELTLTVREEELTRTALAEVIESVMGAKMIVSHKEPTVRGMVTLFLERAPRYGVAYGESVVSAVADACGDRRTVIRLSPHKVMLVLADGMGNGLNAEKNSGYALSLIEGFYRAGFDHETALNNVARLLSLRGKEEFNAVDIAVIDTCKGSVDLIKQGARESFFVCDGAVEVAECGSLPLGIVEDALPMVQSRPFGLNTFLVMVSDGVTDAIGVEQLKELLGEARTVNPDELCTLVTENVTRLATEKGIPADDASVIVARLYKTA